MASQSQSVDDVLVHLMSMGFDYQDCQDAFQMGRITVESAAEWLCAGKPGFMKNVESSSGNLKLRGNSSGFKEGNNPFVDPSSSKPKPEPENIGQSHSAELSQGMEDDQSESQVMSRLHLSETQRQIKDKFVDKQRTEMKQEVIKDKQRRKRDHARILKEIAEDREKQKLTHTSVKQEVVEQKQEETPKPAPVATSHDKCLLKIRMLDGSFLKQSFAASATFKDVWKYITDNNKSRGVPIVAIQPFPHREYGECDMDRTLQELGLTPSDSLVVQKKEIKQATAGTAVSEMLPVDGQPSPVSPKQPGSSSNWGQGQRLDDENPGDEDLADIESDDSEEEPHHPHGGFPHDIPGLGQGLPGFGGHPGMGQGMPGLGGHPGMGQGFPGFGGQGMGQGMPGFGGGGHPGFAGAVGGQMFEGVGQRLGDGHPEQDVAHHNRPARELAAERARQRYQEPQPERSSRSPEPPHPVAHQVPSLLNLCMNHISQRLNDPVHQLRSLSGVAEDLAQKLLDYLLKNRLLKPKTLNAFIPCYLRKLILDCYPYAANELLSAVRHHHQLSQLSLCSCPLITDGGMQVITGLKKLRYLNLRCCKQITNKSLETISALQSLISLNLEETGITESGFEDYLQKTTQQLVHLNLNRTAITEKIIPCLKNMKTLKTLYLEQTKVCGLTGIQDLENLETLDVAHTDVVTDSLLCLQQNKALTCLGISHTEKVHGDRALAYLSGMKLQAINLPSRLTTTDVGMKSLVGFQLTSLDLTNYINVGDDGMQPIGQIITLKKLMLGNTHVTDTGMLFLEGLKNLEVLYLDKTSITDEGASVIKYFCSLYELSLSSTLVTSKFILHGTLDNMHFLTKLNLSRSKVSSKGVKCLKLPNLTLLNLDGTHVKPGVPELLYGTCPNLKNVTSANLVYGNSDEEDN
ncbi:unnamed protein product [Mytilus edulis]|uniref:UBX domain-containing protein n=1 Tax=Mytilus edulis TaxID=6550 RepID=A0A8S3UNI1_MYTED|nr:unnamed protein product [Mytilus edulis]CAG2244274.1 unnamed protein product [Mytilus edulis]